MGVYVVLAFLLIITVGFTTASFEHEMQALETDIMNDHGPVKKSIIDLSTEELIAQLEQEISTKRDGKSGHPIDEDLIKKSVKVNAKKYRKRFNDIIAKKSNLDKIINADAKELFKDEHKKAGKRFSYADFPYSDLLDVLEKGADKNKKREEEESCKDNRSDCDTLKEYCTTHEDKLKDACAKTCEYCVVCKQSLEASYCEFLKRNGKCDDKVPTTRARMARLCGQTCGFCKVPSPPKCSGTANGCCWDKSTTKQDAAGSNCPKCNDHYKFVCKTFKADCPSFRDAGSFMRANCPASCDICGGTCEDNPEKKTLCTFWKKDLKWCEKKKELMKFYCPITCGMC